LIIALVSPLPEAWGAPEPAAEPQAEVQRKRIAFQIGADAFGGIGARFIGGVNATLVYPVVDRVWAGIRPALHLLVPKDSDLDVSWFHPDLAVHVNFFHAPVRLYALVAGGYSMAVGMGLYGGPAHGFSVAAGVGVAWKWRGPLGLFAELAFRGGNASKDQTVLKRDQNGDPICEEECQIYQTEAITRDYKISVLTLNLGLVYAP
jgi:hypothetical protein